MLTQKILLKSDCKSYHRKILNHRNRWYHRKIYNTLKISNKFIQNGHHHFRCILQCGFQNTETLYSTSPYQSFPKQFEFVLQGLRLFWDWFHKQCLLKIPKEK